MTHAALLLIDVQKGCDDPSWGNRNNPEAEQHIALLLAGWRRKSLPIIHIQHRSTEPTSTLRPDQPGFEFKDEATPLNGEKQFTKAVNSAFIGTGLEKYLRTHNIQSLVIVGLTTDHCVSTTTRMAGNLGFDVILVSDATAMFDRAGQDGVRYTASDIHLASLNGEFCDVRSTAQVMNALGVQDPR